MGLDPIPRPIPSWVCLVWVDEQIIEQTQARVQAHPEIRQQRQHLVEHPFGTIKFWWDQGHFLMKGLEKVKAEFSLSTLAYNIRRVLNILGVERLLAVLSERKLGGFCLNLAPKTLIYVFWSSILSDDVFIITIRPALGLISPQFCLGSPLVS